MCVILTLTSLLLMYMCDLSILMIYCTKNTFTILHNYKVLHSYYSRRFFNIALVCVNVSQAVHWIIKSSTLYDDANFSLLIISLPPSLVLGYNLVLNIKAGCFLRYLSKVSVRCMIFIIVQFP